MPGPLSFDAYLGWVNITDPNNIPQDARVISADDLLRYEQLGLDTVAAVNGLSTEVESYNADETTAANLAEPTSATRLAVDALVEGSVDGLQATLDAVPATVDAKLAADVPPAVASAIAADATIQTAATTAVNSKVAGLDLVKRSDKGAPNSFTDEADLYAHHWVSTGATKRLLAGILKAGGWFNFPKGFNYADRKIRSISNDQYISASVDRNNKVMEDALDLQGNVPLSTLSRWGQRIAKDVTTLLLWPFVPTVKVTTKTVKKDGTGDFTTIGAALASITDSSLINTYKILIHPGRYLESGLKPPTGVHLEGTSRDRCIIHAELPDSTTDALLALTSTIDPIYATSLTNLTITGRNVRYPIHPEDAGKNPNTKLVVKNCHIEHFGNQGMRDWRTANPGSGMSASTVWDSWIAWGEGSASGNEVEIDRTTIRGRSSFYVHGTSNHEAPMRHRISRSRIVSTDPPTRRGGMTINPIGSGTDDELTITDSQLDVSFISYQDSPWQTQEAKNQFADHYEIRMTLANCSTVGWWTSNKGKALRITSATSGTTSTVRVSGTAAPILFGEDGLWKYRDGGGGLNGYAWGYWDISGLLAGINGDITVNNTLGRRLGDRSSSPVTLTVTIDGGAPINIVFNTNLTAATNATILASINAALGAAGTASEYLVTQGERYPAILDKELELVNYAVTGIPRFAAVKYGADRRAVELMGTADPASAFLGIALNPIAPGQSGRILTQGRMKFDQLYGFTGGIVAGQAISLSTVTAGAFVTGSAKQVATGFITDWADFTGTR